jgi:glucose/arabinose dehydrogenase
VEEPLIFWDPSIGASGLALYQGDAFPQWQGALFVGTLVDSDVRKLTFVGDSVSEEILFAEIGERIRDVRVGPDGMLYILTDSDQGRVIRVVPDDLSNAAASSDQEN